MFFSNDKFMIFKKDYKLDYKILIELTMNDFFFGIFIFFIMSE